MEIVKFILSAICIIFGLIVFIVGVVGIYRFKYILNRMHSAAMFDSMGLFFICVGCAISLGFDSTCLKIMVVCLFLWIASPVCSHLIAKLEFITDKQLGQQIENDLSEIMEENSDDNDI